MVNNKDREIKLINKIIREAVIHGADAGGSYDSNEENLINAVYDWMDSKHLTDWYALKEVEFDDGWCVLQLVKIRN